METKSSFPITGRLVFGLIVIFLGFIFLLDNLNVIYAEDYLSYWPVFLILFSLVKLTQSKRSGGKFWGLVLTAVGGIILLDNLYVIHFHFWEFWPLILIFIGGSMIWRTMMREQAVENVAVGDSVVNGFAVMGGYRRSINSQDFRGGELTAIMGGCELDLRQASMKESAAVIDVFGVAFR